ncbi:hypothetical protein EU527_12245 [Candidatus Thorarchaeota archaeon]|nr:MAG: hypothetical protein EU527_12245 [Candidatus Thorarchaeota archaeon]
MRDYLYKVVEPSLVAGIEVFARSDVWMRLDNLVIACSNFIIGPPFLMYDFHNSERKYSICYPVTKKVEDSFVSTKVLGRFEVYSIFHYGSHDSIDTILCSFINMLNSIVDTSDITIREIYHEFYPENKSENTTEIQVLIPFERE